MSATDQRAQSAASGSPGAIGDVSFRAVIDGMLEGVAILDHEWRFQYVNEAGAQNLGGTREELLGLSVFDHYPGLRDSPAHRLFTSCLEDGTPQRFEAPFPGADGSLHWFEFSVQPCGEGVLVLSLDITDRHVAADSNVRLQAALESIDLVAISLDPAGRLMFANGALVRTTGWTLEEVLGTDWFARFVPESIRSDLRSLFDEAIRTGEVPRQHEHNLLTRDGRERTVVWNNTILRDGDGTVTAVAAVGEDVTDRRALEAGLRQNSASVEAALDASADIVAIFRPILDPEGRFLDAEVVHANAAALHRWRPGVPFEQIYGHGLLELIPGLRSLVFDLYEEAVRTGREVHAAREVATPGGPRITDMTVTPYEGGFVHVGRDVTELQHATAELREREEELREVLGAVEAILSWSPREGGSLTVSPQIERIFGWRPDQVDSFDAWNALVHPDDLAACMVTWSADPDEWTMEYRIRRADGRYAWVSDRGRRVVDAVTGDRATFGVVTDVTDRVTAGAALADSEERLRQTIEGVEAIVGVQGREGGGLALSPQVERILGWTPAEIPDFATWHSLVHPADLARCMEIWNNEPPTWQLEYRMRRSDGSWSWVVDRGRMVPNADGTGSYTFGIVVDATERHHADEALRRSEERLRRTIEGLDAIVATQEHSGAPVICSPQMERLLGIDPASVTTFAAWRDLVHPDDLERCMALWTDRPAAWEVEYRMRHADGHDVWVLDRGRRTAHEDGLGEGTFGIIVDVTDRHAAAEALRGREEQLRRIVEGVDAIISYQEAAGEPVVISPQTLRILGYPPEAVAPFEAWEAITHPDDIPRCEAAWNGPGQSWDMDYRMRRADGAWIWVNDRGRRITHDDGRAAGMFGVVTDITAQHEAADRLRASEARFRAMFEENPEAIGVLRPILAPDGRFLDAEFLAANRTTRERWLGGVSTDLVAGTRSSGLWFTAGEEVRDAMALVAERGEAWRSEVRTTRDGIEDWSDLSVFPFEAGIAFVGRDITEQKRSELAVRDSEARFRAVTDSAGDAIITFDSAGVIVGWNPSAERLFGFPAGDLGGRPVTALMPDSHVAEQVAQGQGTGSGLGGSAGGGISELTGHRADGSAFPIELSLAGWSIGDRRFATAIVRDVTERQLAEDAVHEAAAFQRSIVDAMAEGMIIVGPDRRIRSANARAAAVLGIDPDVLEGSVFGGSPWEVLGADGTPVPLEGLPAMATLMTGESRRDVEVLLGRPDGTRTWLRINSEPLRDRDGVVIAAIATFSDITSEREMSEQLRRSQRMEAVGQLAGGVAHDFNNLLAAIRGYGELALNAMPDELPARADVEGVIRAADRAAALTRQLLLFSRRQVLTPRLVDPGEVVDGLIPMLRQLVGEHIELQATCDPQRAVVLADPGQLEQVIVNLVVNARDAMPGGGRIDVMTRRTSPDDPLPAGTRPAWPAVRITVADTGQGIDPAVLPHIFEPFFTTKEAGRGSGMGLATIYGIVGASGGTVAVATSPGRGTTFTIDLPAVDDADPAVPEVETAAAVDPAVGEGRDTGRGIVLLVEDDAAVRAILGRQLAGLGWRVVERSSGTAAAAAAAAGDLAQPDLLVTDVRMPGVQGPDLARRLRATWPGLPVLFITGLADEVDADPDESWMHVLTKPFDVGQLGRAIETTLADGS